MLMNNNLHFLCFLPVISHRKLWPLWKHKFHISFLYCEALSSYCNMYLSWKFSLICLLSYHCKMLMLSAPWISLNEYIEICDEWMIVFKNSCRILWFEGSHFKRVILDYFIDWVSVWLWFHSVSDALYYVLFFWYLLHTAHCAKDSATVVSSSWCQ